MNISLTELLIIVLCWIVTLYWTWAIANLQERVRRAEELLEKAEQQLERVTKERDEWGA